jgi:hypothetical protein
MYYLVLLKKNMTALISELHIRVSQFSTSSEKTHSSPLHTAPEKVIQTDILLAEDQKKFDESGAKIDSLKKILQKDTTKISISSKKAQPSVSHTAPEEVIPTDIFLAENQKKIDESRTKVDYLEKMLQKDTTKISISSKKAQPSVSHTAPQEVMHTDIFLAENQKKIDESGAKIDSLFRILQSNDKKETKVTSSSSAMPIIPVTSSSSAMPPKVTSSSSAMPPKVTSSSSAMPPKVTSSSSAMPPKVTSSSSAMPPKETHATALHSLSRDTAPVVLRIAENHIRYSGLELEPVIYSESTHYFQTKQIYTRFTPIVYEQSALAKEFLEEVAKNPHKLDDKWSTDPLRVPALALLYTNKEVVPILLINELIKALPIIDAFFNNYSLVGPTQTPLCWFYDPKKMESLIAKQRYSDAMNNEEYKEKNLHYAIYYDLPWGDKNFTPDRSFCRKYQIDKLNFLDALCANIKEGKNILKKNPDFNEFYLMLALLKNHGSYDDNSSQREIHRTFFKQNIGFYFKLSEPAKIMKSLVRTWAIDYTCETLLSWIYLHRIYTTTNQKELFLTSDGRKLQITTALYHIEVANFDEYYILELQNGPTRRNIFNTFYTNTQFTLEEKKSYQKKYKNLFDSLIKAKCQSRLFKSRPLIAELIRNRRLVFHDNDLIYKCLEPIFNPTDKDIDGLWTTPMKKEVDLAVADIREIIDSRKEIEKKLEQARSPGEYRKMLDDQIDKRSVDMDVAEQGIQPLVLSASYKILDQLVNTYYKKPNAYEIMRSIMY